jgi:prolyl oligopeptidase
MWRNAVVVVVVVVAAIAAIAVIAACTPSSSSTTRSTPPTPPTAPVLTSSAPPLEQRPAPVVPAARRPVTHTYFGTNVTDDYEWLEDGQSAETKAFVDAENALTRSTIDSFSERPSVRERVASILNATAADWFAVTNENGQLFALKDAPPKQQRLLVALGSSTGGGGGGKIPSSERVILDPNVLDPSGKTTIDFFVPSPDGQTVAVSLSKDGTESGDLHLIEVATGKDKNETIARVNGGTAGGSVAWNADGTGFHYTRYPRQGERPAADLDFYQQVYFHKVGTQESADTYAMGKELPRIAEIELVRSDFDGGGGSGGGKRTLARVSNGDGGEIEFHVLDSGKWIRLSKFEDELSAASFGPEGKVYAVTRKGAPRGKVVVFSPPFVDQQQPKPADVLPESPDTVIEDLIVTKSSIYAIEIADGPSRVRRFPLSAKAEPLAQEPKKPAPAKKGAPPPSPPTPPPTIPAGARGLAAALLPLPPVSSITSSLKVGDDLLLRVESYVEPPKWMLYKSSEHRLVATGLAKKPAFDMNDVEVSRESCVSKDGTRVPMTILKKKSTKMPLDGSMPAFLTGYGGFGVTVKPRMRATFRVWLDHGGVVAETNLRGGGERGEAWHRAGYLTKKQNVFDDFAACAKTLFDLKYTRPERLAIHGRSNGGLLMGAELVQHPEMFRAVATGVGIYDMLRNELSPNGAFNITEYGSVKDEAQFRALHAYSPLHNVKNDVGYPAVLFMSGANDPRVDPYHSRKMTARLQASMPKPTERQATHPILLRADAATGHGMGTPLSAEIEETTDMLTFLLHEVAAH